MISALMASFVKRKVLAVQEFTFLVIKSFQNAFSPPRYVVDTLIQMDIIGVGSLPIVVLTGFFTGGVLALQSYRTLSTFGEVGLLGQVVALSVVRELGPVLTALMVAGRNSSGIASEIGSMLVSEQVDAMRAFGTDPLRKLVTPRLYATLLTMPLLTILSDFCGLLGQVGRGGVVKIDGTFFPGIPIFQGFQGCPRVVGRAMGIAHSHGDGAMSHQLLDRPQVHPS